MYCPDCGTQLVDGSSFCGNCGAKIEAQQAAPQPEPDYEATAPLKDTYEAPAAPVAQPQPEQEPQVVYQPPEEEASVFDMTEEPSEPTSAYDFQEQELPVFPEVPAEKPKKKKKVLLWIVIVLAALLVIGAAVVALDYFQVIDLGFFAEGEPVAYEVISYDAKDTETLYKMVELNDEGLPRVVIWAVEGEELTVTFKYKGADIVGAAVEGVIEGEDGTAELEFDGQGNIVSFSGKADEEEFSYECEYKYDEKGNKTKETYFNDGEKMYSHSYKYDEYGNVVYDKYTNYEDSDLDSITTFEYEYEDGKMVEAVCEEERKEVYTALFEYNANGDVVWSEYEYADRFETTEYTYKDGKLVKKVLFYNKDEQNRYEYEYNEDGLMSKETVYLKGALEGHTEYYWHPGTKELSTATYNVLKLLELAK